MATRPPTRQQLQALAHEIVRTEVRGDAQRAAHIGRKILNRCYGGSVDAFQSKEPGRSDSLSTLATMLGRSRGRVWGYVAAAVVYADLPADLRDRLTPGHLEALYAAKDVERERLARESVELDHTVEELRARVAGDIVPEPEETPALDRSPIARAERALAVMIRRAATATPEERPELKRRAAAMISELQGLLAAL